MLRDRLLLLGSAERTDAFLEWWESDQEVGIDDFYAALRLTWTTAENVYLDRDRWTSLWEWESARPDLLQTKLMTSDERAALISLPADVTVYRGYGDRDTIGALPAWWGISWTLDRQRALWFARRFAVLHSAGRIATATIKRQAIIALLHDRNETEVILVPPHDLHVLVEAVA
jgi:hypothetical protein